MSLVLADSRWSLARETGLQIKDYRYLLYGLLLGTSLGIGTLEGELQHISTIVTALCQFDSCAAASGVLPQLPLLWS